MISLVSTAVMIALFVLGLVAVWLIPKWQVGQLRKQNSQEIKADVLFTLENEARKTLAQIVGGLLVLIGLYFTAENVRVTQEVAEKNRGIAQEGQLTDRFTKAVAQLGDQKLEVRVGGIYALERIAKDSEKDYWSIMEVLTAFVRERSNQTSESLADNKSSAPKIDIDIQAALTVIGRREKTLGNGESQPLNLRRANLEGANLADANLRGADFSGANLRKVIFSGANLHGAHFIDTDLSGAILTTAKIGGLQYTSGNKGIGTTTIFFRANLDGANFNYAEISNTDLSGGYNLKWEQVEHARFSENVKLPPELEARRQAK